MPLEKHVKISADTEYFERGDYIHIYHTALIDSARRQVSFHIPLNPLTQTVMRMSPHLLLVGPAKKRTIMKDTLLGIADFLTKLANSTLLMAWLDRIFGRYLGSDEVSTTETEPVAQVAQAESSDEVAAEAQALGLDIGQVISLLPVIIDFIRKWLRK